MPDPRSPLRVVVLISGTGTLLQALLRACAEPDYPAEVVAVGSDRPDIAGLQIAAQAGAPTFVVPLRDFADRQAWDQALTAAAAEFEPDLVVSAGFMRLLGSHFLARFPGAVLNTHPALLPAFPGAHPVADALAYGVTVTGCTVHLVDAGVDTGPVVAQRPVRVEPGDDEESLHERIKVVERLMLTDVVARMGRHGWRVDGRQVEIEEPSDGG